MIQEQIAVTARRLVLMLASLTMTQWATGAGMPAEKQVTGLHEQVAIGELGLSLDAKMDTGAQTVSLSAMHIKEYEKDGERWVRFQLSSRKRDLERWGLHGQQPQTIHLPLTGDVRIKQRAESLEDGERRYRYRPLVELSLCVGDRQARVTANLADRHRFAYPLLIGANAMRELGLVVDPSRSLSLGAPRCTMDGGQRASP